jgi:hypothetical protein
LASLLPQDPPSIGDILVYHSKPGVVQAVFSTCKIAKFVYNKNDNLAFFMDFTGVITGTKINPIFIIFTEISLHFEAEKVPLFPEICVSI